MILGSAEAEVAAKFVEAARTYAGEPAALQLRAMNIIYETTKERGATILMPSAMVGAMDPAGPLALAIAASGGVDLGGKKAPAKAKTAVPTTGRRRRKPS